MVTGAPDALIGDDSAAVLNGDVTVVSSNSCSHSCCFYFTSVLVVADAVAPVVTTVVAVAADVGLTLHNLRKSN